MQNLTISFDVSTPEGKEEAERALRAEDVYAALDNIVNEVFRPARKHGYIEADLQKLLDENEAVHTVIGRLEEKFFDILREYNITL
jgi:hypothetical protein